MTEKEKELALIMREVGAYAHHGDFNMGYSYEFQPDQLVRFAALLEAKIRADEREACAEVCMSVSGKYIGAGAGASPWSFGASEAASKCAKYIRARHIRARGKK